MADIATRSTQNIHGGGVGYKPTNTKPTARYTVTKTITKTSATLATVTMVITIKTNSEFVAVGLGETLTYQLVIDGVQRGSVVLKTATQTMNASGTYSRTLVARNVPLDHRTTQPAYLRLVNNKRSDWTFNSNTQGGDQIVGLPIGIQQSNFSKFERFDVKNGTSTFNLSLSRISSNVTHTLRLKHGTTTIATWTGQGNLTSRTLTQAQSQTLLNRMSDVLSATVSLEVDTVYSGTALYTQTRSAIADVASSEYPDLTVAPTITDRTSVFNTIGAFVQGQSTFRMSINGVSIGYGTTLDYYSYEWNGQTHTSQNSAVNFGPINSSGKMRFRAGLRTKRPITRRKWSEYITVLPWSAPRSNSVKVQRCKSNGTIDPAGSYIRVTGSHSVSPLKVGTANKNTMRVLVRYRVANTTTWTNALNKTYPAGTVSTSEGHTLGGGAIDPTKTYEFEVIAYDRYANAKVTGLIPTERVLISKVRNDGVGFGKIRERGIIDAKGDVYVDGSVDVTNQLRVNGQTIIRHAGTINVKDTRDIVTPTDNGIGVDYEFKRNTTIGISGIASYSAVQTFQGWMNSSGGNVHQVAFTSSSNSSDEGRIFYRSAVIGAEKWGHWTELMTANNAVRSYTDQASGVTWKEHLKTIIPKIQDRTPYQMFLFSSGGWRTVTGARSGTTYGSFMVYGYPESGAVTHAVLSNGKWTYKVL